MPKKFQNTPSLVMTGPYFKQLLWTVVICQAKSMKKNETSKLSL